MKTKMKIIGILSMVLLIVFAGCKKDDEKATLNIRLTDAPGMYEHVYIDVQGIEIYSENGGWISPDNFNAGIYDLLEFNNGLDTLLCSLEMPVGKVSQIRLILGNNNSVVIESVTYPLSTPSAQQSGLKINLHEDLQANVSYTIILDFDAAKSIVQLPNGTYILKPVIRAFSSLQNGKIKGLVQPMIAQPVVYAIKGTDTVSTIPNADGFFMLCGLNGTYDLHVIPANVSFQILVVAGVQTSWGNITDVGSIILQ